nr:wax ester/triacylglycerol synthase domain-containing protein [Actinophytocola sp.]
MPWPDDLGWPQDIGAIGILDGTTLFDPDGRFRIEAARKAVEERLTLVPRFRQTVNMPRLGLGWPLWVDAADVDLGHHVRAVDVPYAYVLPAAERLRRRPLDRYRPLWEIWFLTGLPDRRVGCYIRVHHAIARAWTW